MAVFTTIDDAGLFNNSKLYTGTGGATQAQTGVGFAPDVVWVKDRSGAESHVIGNTVRGGNKYLITNSNAAEGSLTTYLKSFDADGFTVGTGGFVGSSGDDYVGWCWKGGTTSGIDATGASITPAGYSFNATSGCSVVEWAGTGVAGTLPHGLGTAPKMIIVKRLEGSNWTCGHEAAGWTKNWVFNEAEGVSTNTYWNDTNPTSVLFSVGTNIIVNASGSNYIGYLWAPVQGYSAMGYYAGNGNADGTFIYTGFKPAWVMVKRFATGVSWTINDNKRLGYNSDNNSLYANNTAAANTDNNTNLLSNGFKQISTEANNNSSGGDFLYTAFAENPFVNSSGVPGNAR